MCVLCYVYISDFLFIMLLSVLYHTAELDIESLRECDVVHRVLNVFNSIKMVIVVHGRHVTL